MTAEGIYEEVKPLRNCRLSSFDAPFEDTSSSGFSKFAPGVPEDHHQDVLDIAADKAFVARTTLP